MRAFTYLIAKEFGYDLDFRRADAQDIAVLANPGAHSAADVGETFRHLMDKERAVDPSLVHEGEPPAAWKMPEIRHDPRLPEDPRLLYVLVDAVNPESFKDLLDNRGQPMTPEYLREQFQGRLAHYEHQFGAEKAEEKLHDVRFILTCEGGLVWLDDFRAEVENALTVSHELPDRYKIFDVFLKDAGEDKDSVIKIVATTAHLSLEEARARVENTETSLMTGLSHQDTAVFTAKLKDAGAAVETEGELDIRKAEGQYFEIPESLVIGQLANIGENNPKNALLLDKKERELGAEDKDRTALYPQDYLDGPYLYAEDSGKVRVFNNRLDMLTGRNIDSEKFTPEDKELRKWALEGTPTIQNGEEVVLEGWIHQQARRLVDGMTRNPNEIPTVDRDELRDLFFTYELMTHPRVQEHNTDYRPIHNWATELFVALAEVINERYEGVPETEKGVFLSTAGMSGAGKSTGIREAKAELDGQLSLIRSGSNPDMKLNALMHDNGFPTRIDVTVAPIEVCLTRALGRREVEGRITTPEMAAPMGIKAMRRIPEELHHEKVDKVVIGDNSGPKGTPYVRLAETDVISREVFEHFDAKTRKGQGFAEGEEITALKLGETEGNQVKVLKIYGERAAERLAEYLRDGRRTINEHNNTPYEIFDRPQTPIDAGLSPERSIDYPGHHARASGRDAASEIALPPANVAAATLDAGSTTPSQGAQRRG